MVEAVSYMKREDIFFLDREFWKIFIEMIKEEWYALKAEYRKAREG